MIKEFIVSFFDNVKTKTTNPFLGTLVLVWIFENWILLFTLFHLDERLPLHQKIEALNVYLNAKAFSLNLVKCITISIIVLISTYALLNISRYIVNVFEKKVTPWVYKISDKSSIVLKEEYERVVQSNKQLSDRIESEMEARFGLQAEILRLETRIKELLQEKEEPNKDQSENFRVKVDGRSQKQTITERLLRESSESEKIGLLLIDMERMGYLDKFREYLDIVINKRYIPIKEEEDSAFKYFLRHGVIQVTDTDFNDDTQRINLTPLGSKIKEQFLLGELKKNNTNVAPQN